MSELVPLFTVGLHDTTYEPRVDGLPRALLLDEF